MSNPLDKIIQQINEGNYEKALAQLKLVEDRSRLSELHYYLGFCYGKLKDRQGAEVHFLEATENELDIFVYKSYRNLYSNVLVQYEIDFSIRPIRHP